MASKGASAPVKDLFNGFRTYKQSTPRSRQSWSRPMATVAYLPHPVRSAMPNKAQEGKDAGQYPPSAARIITSPLSYKPPPNPFLKTVSCTRYAFPSFKPVGFSNYPSTHLSLPLRKDILHRAVIFEGDATRSGTANTKWRSEVHGSSRKIRPQKGSGSARLGDKKSPMLRGGGVAFGPKPRDFSTELPRKVYDLAWRTALSFRYKMGELIVIDSAMEIQNVHPHSMDRFLCEILQWNHLKEAGRPMFVSRQRRASLFDSLEGDEMAKYGRALDVNNVDVKNLLEGGRLVVEDEALQWMLEEHESDLPSSQRLDAWRTPVLPQRALDVSTSAQ